MKVCVLGAGALGGRLAWQLDASGTAEISVAVRRAVQADFLGRSGLTLLDSDDRPLGTRYLRAFTPSTGDVPQDVVFIATKAYDVASALGAFESLITNGTVLVSLQNGVGAISEIMSALRGKRATVLRAVTANGATRKDDGHIRLGGSGPTYVGQSSTGTAATEQALDTVTELLGSAGWKSERVSDIAPYEWGKLLVNVGINPVTAILGDRNGVVDDIEPAAQLARQLVNEAQLVITRLGIELPWSDPFEEVLRVSRATASNSSSMLQDLQAGRQTEIDYINGAIVHFGQSLRIPTATNEAVVKVVKAMEMLRRGVTAH